MNRRWSFVLLFSLLAACGPDRSNPSVDDGSPRVEIGTGTSAFEPLAEMAAVPLVFGPQGGYHIDVAVRLRNVPIDDLLLRYEVYDGSDSIAFGALYAVEPRRLRADGPAWLRLGDRVVLDVVDPETIRGRAIEVVVVAQPGGGPELTDARTVVVRY